MLVKAAAKAGRARSRDRSFYGPRISRRHEAWDTIDPRLVEALVALLPHLRKRMVWEPAAGCGVMVDQLETCGVKVFASTDIMPRRNDVAKRDLFSFTEMIHGCTAIVTNPPWGKLATPFVRHCIKLAQAKQAMVCMLLPVPWITAKGCADLTGSIGFCLMIVPRFRARWMTEQEEAKLKHGAKSPKMNHVWLVWNFARKGKGPPPRIAFHG